MISKSIGKNKMYNKLKNKLMSIKESTTEEVEALEQTSFLGKMAKRGNLGMGTVLTIVGLLVASKVAVELLPDILSNFSDASIWTGTAGTIVTSVFSILIVVGFLVLLMKGMGLNIGGGKKGGTF